MTKLIFFPLSTIEMFLFVVCLCVSSYIVHSLKTKQNPKADIFFELMKTSCFILAGQSKWAVFRPRCKMTLTSLPYKVVYRIFKILLSLAYS